MAEKSLTVVRSGRYGTRMLKAGDSYDATGPDARLYTKLGWMTEAAEKPKRAPKAEAPAKPKAAPKPKRVRKAKAKK